LKITALEKHVSENVKITYPFANGKMVPLSCESDSGVRKSAMKERI